MGRADSVTFTCYITGEDREDYYRKASIYCMCSYEEGFPMVVLEAWVYGISVVTTPVGGLPDVLENGKNALVFDFGDWQGLAKQLSKLIEDAELRRAMADYSRTFVIESFATDKINDDLTTIYKNL